MQNRKRDGEHPAGGRKQEPNSFVEFLLSDNDISTRPQAKSATHDTDEVPRFLEQAKSVIAQERGWNARARRRLLELAETLHLSAAERDAAIAGLHQSGGMTAMAEPGVQSRRQGSPLRKRFHERAVQVLGRADHESFNFQEERDLIQYGVEECGLSREEAAEAARAIREELGVAFLSQTDAVSQVRRQFSDAYGRENLSRNEFDAIAELGRQLGLSDRQIHEISQECAADKGRRNHRSNEFRSFVVVTGIATGFTLAMLVAFLSLLRRDKLGDVAPPPPTPAFSPTNNWFDHRLLLDVADAKQQIPEAASILGRIETGDVDARALAYREFFGGASDEGSLPRSEQAPDWMLQLSREQLDRLADVVSGLIAREPSHTLASQLTGRLAALIDEREGEQLVKPAAYGVSDWGARTLLLGHARHNARPSAGLLSREQLAAVMTIDPALFDGESSELAQAVELELVRLHFRSMRRLAVRTPDKLSAVYQQVLSDARVQVVPREERQAMQTVMLCDYIENVGPDAAVSSDLSRMLLDVIGTADANRLEKFETVAQTCKNAGLKSRVALLVETARNNL